MAEISDFDVAELLKMTIESDGDDSDEGEEGQWSAMARQSAINAAEKAANELHTRKEVEAGMHLSIRYEMISARGKLWRTRAKRFFFKQRHRVPSRFDNYVFSFP